MAYSDVHRAMLQTLMHEKFMTEENVQAKFAELWGAYSCNEALPTDSKGFKTFFNVINEKIGRLGLKYAEIKQIKDDNMADKYWGLASIPNDLKAENKESGLLDPKIYSDTELHLFKKIIGILVTESRYKGLLDHNKCINLGRELPKPHALKAEEASLCLDRLVKEGWLRVVEDAAGARGRHNAKRITLGIAALLDAKAYILKQWPDQEERCCVWQADWLFKWVGDESGEQQEADSQSNAAGKRAAPADSEGRKRARAAEADAESEDE